MKKITINETEVSLPYLEVLENAVNVRRNKRKIYKDEYLNDSVDFLLLTLENKMKRIKDHIKNKTIKNEIENFEDCVWDAINYLIFLNCVVIKNEKTRNNN